MTNPFDNADGQFYVLRNGDGQHSLWPSFATVPVGWVRVHGPDARHKCLDFVNENWTDMRPNRLPALDVA